MSHRPIILLAIAAIAGSALLIILLRPGLFRDGERLSAASIAAGRTIYQESCARCHGASLEGQPNWRTRLPSGRLPAPPHDASGHTWHHSDRVLFEITKRGTAAVVGGGYESDMPGFGSLLSDDEIRAVLAFIKSTWPERERRYQEEITRRDRAER
jgi:mono/diheme cytochrome c family protein